MKRHSKLVAIFQIRGLRFIRFLLRMSPTRNRAISRRQSLASILLIAAAGISSMPGPALALDVYNCTNMTLRVMLFNQRDRLQVIPKKQFTVTAGAVAMAVPVPGAGPHKLALLRPGIVRRPLANYSGILDNGSYVIFFDPSGQLNLQTGNGC